MYPYTGIGSREVPNKIMSIIIEIGEYMARRNYILRSGGANGSDRGFELGCDIVRGSKEIYIPWEGFNKSNSTLILKDSEAYNIAKKYHPSWNTLSPSARKLHARNSHQVLGYDLKSPSLFIVCYTKNGRGGGGTGQALRIARDYNIPIFDLGLYEELNSTDIKTKFINFILHIKDKVAVYE